MGSQHSSGARNTFDQPLFFNNIPPIPMIGLLNENYYPLLTKATLINDIELSHTITENPFTNQNERYLQLMLKSKYDGKGNDISSTSIRKPIDIALSIDISGSMSCSISHEPTPRLTLAKNAIQKLISQLQPNDYFSLTAFNTQYKHIIPLINKTEYNEQHEKSLFDLTAGGGTHLYSALKGAFDSLEKSKNDYKRIILVTDVCGFDENEYKTYFNEIVNKFNIGITIIAISDQSDINMCEIVSYSKGCNYYLVTKESDLEKYLVKQFNFICFPYCSDIDVSIICKNAFVSKIYGSDVNENADVQNEKENKTKSICKFKSAFPSEIITTEQGKMYVNGGLILLKIEKNDKNDNNNLEMDIQLNYVDNELNKHTQSYNYVLSGTDDNKGNDIGSYLIYYKEYCDMIREISELYINKIDNRNKARLEMLEELINSTSKDKLVNMIKNGVVEVDINENGNHLKERYVDNVERLFKGLMDYKAKREQRNLEIHNEGDAPQPAMVG